MQAKQKYLNNESLTNYKHVFDLVTWANLHKYLFDTYVCH